MDLALTKGDGIQNFKSLVDVIYGWPPMSLLRNMPTKLEWLSYHKELAAAIPNTMAVGKRTATTILEVFIVAVSFGDW